MYYHYLTLGDSRPTSFIGPTICAGTKLVTPQSDCSIVNEGGSGAGGMEEPLQLGPAVTLGFLLENLVWSHTSCSTVNMGSLGSMSLYLRHQRLAALLSDLNTESICLL